MRVYLVGANLEENLALGILSAIVESAGHKATVLPFNDGAEAPSIVARILREAPEVVGLSIQFQHRSREFLALSQALRAGGFLGHVTAGGQFPTLAYKEVIERGHGVDTVVLYDGEETLADLLLAIETGKSLHDVPGLALLSDDGVVLRTQERRLVEDLDAVPFPKRYRSHARHMGVPFIPIMGSRGCWGQCSYCSITTFYREARAYAGAKLLRTRTPENIAAEMALLWHAAGGAGVFCFHDDNFLLPRPEDSTERVRAIRSSLDGYGVGKAALVGKCRPDAMTAELATELAALGVIRLYVGVENASEAGGAHLGRGKQQKAIDEALEACRSAGIFVCYNLLIFEPDATLDDVRVNVQFIRDHADHPVNFCRAEPYYGTLLHRAVSEKNNLGGSYLGFNYRIADARTELLFRICSAAFRERNFAPSGVANRYMGLGYAAKILEHFYPPPRGASWTRRATDLTRAIALDTAAFLERAIALAADTPLDDRETVERATALLGLEIAASDRRWLAAIGELFAEMERFAASPDFTKDAPQATPKFRQLYSGLALGLTLAMATGCGKVTVIEPGSTGTGTGSGGHGGAGGHYVTDPPPWDGGQGGFIADPPPPDAGTGGQGGFIADPPPPDAGTGGQGGFFPDPPPPDMDAGGASLVVDSDRALASVGSPGARRPLDLVGKWEDSSPDDCVRTRDLPLFLPPDVSLAATRDPEDEGMIWVSLHGATDRVSTRWEADGDVVGEGTRVGWRPSGSDDRIRVAVRSLGGVAVKSLGAGDVTSG